MNTLTVDEIQAAIQARLEVVRAAKNEYDRLEAALEALGPIVEPPPTPLRAARPSAKSRSALAPYGYKKDGTPRKRPGRKAETETPPDASSGSKGQAVLRVMTGSVPAVKGDAEPVYVTQEGGQPS